MVERACTRATRRSCASCPPATHAETSASSTNSTTGGPAAAVVHDAGAVTVAVSAGERVHFRRLAHGDYWFDGHDGRTGCLRT
ncbi:hypothetical protein ATKI12_3401 [Kitasatospora sp. Ki12]